jgi:CO/xanthine dehydrogenase Mo-binding subunit
MPPVIGALGTVVRAPAIGTAIFAAVWVWVRVRYLPIRPAPVPEAVGHA